MRFKECGHHISPNFRKALQGPVKVNYGQATESVANQAEIRELFPHTYGMPVVEFVPDEAPERVEEPFNVGIILSGGQAPGGHNVVSGIFDGPQEPQQGKIVFMVF